MSAGSASSARSIAGMADVGPGSASAASGSRNTTKTMSTTTLPRRQLGKYLRDWRTRAGMTIADAARLMEWGASTLQRLEKGQADRIRTIDIQELSRIYGIPEHLADGLRGLAQQTSAQQGWWHASAEALPEAFEVYPGLEAAAEQVRIYDPEAVPALLRTADYASALARSARVGDESQVDRLVRQTLQRQGVIQRRHTPARVDVVLHEAVLHRIVGDPKVMAVQLRQLAEIGTRDNVSVSVLPFSAGLPLGVASGGFTVLEFGTDRNGVPNDPPLVHSAGLGGDLYLEATTELRRYDQAFECLRVCALDVQRSRQLLRRLAKEL